MKGTIKRLCILAIAAWLMLNSRVMAQQSIQAIGLEDVLQIAGANNLTIQEYKQWQELALADQTKAREWWLPDLYAGISIHQLWGTAMNADGRFFTDVDRQNFWKGLGLNAEWNFSEGIYGIRSARLRTEAVRYESQAARNNALLEVITVYYDFLASQLYYLAYEQLTNQADTIAKQIGIQAEAGLRYQSEHLLARSNYGQLKIEMLNAKVDYETRSARLVNLLNVDPGVRLVSIDTVLVPLQLINGEANAPLADSAYRHRPEWHSMELTKQALQQEKKTTTTGLLLPRLRIGTYGSHFGDIFSPSYPTSEINVELVWRIPLGRLTLAGDFKQFNARIGIQQNRLEQFKNQATEELVVTSSSMLAAQEQMEIAQESSTLAGEALQQSIQRQQLGTVRPLEILQAQEIFIKSRLSYLKAVSDYNKQQYRLLVAMGNNL